MKKLRFTLLLSLCLVSDISIAQETIDISDTIDATEETLETNGKMNALGISAGFPGFTFDYSRKISENFSAKIRYNFFKIENYNIGEIDISGNAVTAIVSGESSTLDLLMEISPFKSSSFKLVGGLGIINKMKFDILMEYDESVTFGDVVLTKEDYGNLNIGFSWEKVAPYIGFGFGRAVPKGKLGIGIEAGYYYSQTPKITLDATKLLAPTATQEEKVQQTFKTWQFIPLFQLRLAYAL
jgi:hypothetical protein